MVCLSLHTKIPNVEQGQDFRPAREEFPSLCRISVGKGTGLRMRRNGFLLIQHLIVDEFLTVDADKSALLERSCFPSRIGRRGRTNGKDTDPLKMGQIFEF